MQTAEAGMLEQYCYYVFGEATVDIAVEVESEGEEI